MIEAGFNLVGLLFTGIGAWIASRAVIITHEQATQLSGPYYGGNNALRDSLLTQSHAARKGLWCIVAGTGLQMVALIYTHATW
ncbi:hypothetical protein SAMN05414138_1022 [Rhodoplanes sp. JGI PP 4-B12]|nr:hypothetical protein SAMN05414138_1022 [Rhodoplanes sp. JGI PP 4-B12]